ncbi:MAG: N-acetylornithine carbamoyltransferase [bacterium]|nr:N-acetylornithine carbamoyltransferase [bacterium]
MPHFSEKILTAIFANPSLRTRLSFESGMKKMNGKVNILNTQDSWQFEYENGVKMDGDKQEHIKEAAKVISKYTDLIAMRNSALITTQANTDEIDYQEYKKDIPMTELVKYAEKPVINMESNIYHPCQSMADMMTLCEKFGDPSKKKYVLTWVPHPKNLPTATPNSQLITPQIFDMDITLACPKGLELDPEIVGSNFKISHSQKEALENADVVVAKSWFAKNHKGHDDWTITEEKMAITNNAYFMHCLPIRRNIVATDKVIDSPNSLIFQEAENRMWVQMAIINYLLTQE